MCPFFHCTATPGLESSQQKITLSPSSVSWLSNSFWKTRGTSAKTENTVLTWSIVSTWSTFHNKACNLLSECTVFRCVDFRDYSKYNTKYNNLWGVEKIILGPIKNKHEKKKQTLNQSVNKLHCNSAPLFMAVCDILDDCTFYLDKGCGLLITSRACVISLILRAGVIDTQLHLTANVLHLILPTRPE